MKTMKHFISAIALPVAILTAVSCAKGVESKSLTFMEARDFADANYQEHALDTIPVNYYTTINSVNVDLVFSAMTPIGTFDNTTIAFGLSGINIIQRDKYAYCMSTKLLDTVQHAYSTFRSLSLSFLPSTPVALTDYFELEDNKDLKVGITTTSGVTNALINVANVFTSALTAGILATGYVDPDDIPDIDQISQGSSINPLAPLGILAFLVGQVVSSSDAGKTAVAALYDNCSIAIDDPASSSEDEKFDIYAKTDEHGYVTNLNGVFGAKLNIGGSVATYVYDDKKPSRGDKPSGIGDIYRFSLKGTVNVDFNVSTEFIG